MTNLKQCDTSTRVFKTLLYIKDNPASVRELVEHFENTYTSEVFIKYIHTLKALGIDVIKNKDKYTVLNYPPYLDLTEKETEGFKLINKIAFPEKISRGAIHQFTSELEKHLTGETLERLYKNKILKEHIKYDKKYEELLENLESYLTNKYELKIFLKGNTVYTGCPTDLYYDNNKIFYSLFSKKQGTKFDIDITKIKDIEILSDHNNDFDESKAIRTSITFLLKDRLARSYKLKDGEKIVAEKEDGSKVITNNHEPENILIKRLLRYEDLCELLSPIQTKAMMKKMLDNMIKLYEE